MLFVGVFTHLYEGMRLALRNAREEDPTKAQARKFGLLDCVRYKCFDLRGRSSAVCITFDGSSIS